MIEGKRTEAPLKLGPPRRSLVELYFELGEALAAHDRHKEAVAAFERALAEGVLDPLLGQVQGGLADAYRLAGEPAKALRTYLETALIGREGAVDLLKMSHAHALLTRDVVAAAGEWIEREWAVEARRVARGPALAEVVHFLGRTALYLSWYPEALSLFREASELLPGDARVQEGLGEALWQTGDLSSAVERLRQARRLALDGDHPARLPTIDAKLAQVHAASGAYQAAIDIIAGLDLEGHPRAYELLLVRAECSLLLGRTSEALEAVDDAAKLRTLDLRAELLRARAWIAVGEYTEALAAADLASQLDPSDREVSIIKAQALLEGQIDAAQGERILHRAVERWAESGSIDELVKLVLRGREANGNAHYFVAEIYRALWRPDGPTEVERDLSVQASARAQTELERALDLGVQASARAQRLKAELLAGSKAYEQAAEAFFAAGREYHSRSEYGLAAESLERASELKRDDPLTYWYWADALRFSSGPQSAEPDSTLGRRILELWNRGIALKPTPSPEESWVYTSRALINELFAVAAEPSERRRLWWESIVYLERAILLLENDPYRWTYVSRNYKYLELEGVAIQASDAALKRATDDTARGLVLEEMAAVTANSGRYSESADAISARLALGETPWAHGVLAYIQLHQERYPEALATTEKAVAVEPDDIWDRTLRALCHRMLGDYDSARRDSEFVFSRYNESERENLDLFGTAALDIGKIDSALAIFTRAAENATESRSAVFSGLALARLAAGDIAAGEEALRTAIAVAINPRHVDDILIFDIPGAEHASADWARGVEARAVMARVRGPAEKRRKQLLGRRSPEEELRSPAIVADSGEAARWRELATQATLARLYTERGAVSDAEATYRVLTKAGQLFPEAAGQLLRFAEEAEQRA